MEAKIRKRWLLLTTVLLLSVSMVFAQFGFELGALGLIPTDLDFSGMPFLFYGGFEVVL